MTDYRPWFRRKYYRLEDWAKPTKVLRCVAWEMARDSTINQIALQDTSHKSASREEGWQPDSPHITSQWLLRHCSKILAKGPDITKLLSPLSLLTLFCRHFFFLAFSLLLGRSLSPLLFPLLIHSREWNRRRSSWTQLILASCMGWGGGDHKRRLHY